MGGTFGDLLRNAGLESSGEPEPTAAAPATPTPPSGDDAPVYARKFVVRRSKKGHGGKTVTAVQGVVQGHALLLARLKKELGSGGRIKDGQIVLQGDQVERVARWFESQGVPKVIRA